MEGGGAPFTNDSGPFMPAQSTPSQPNNRGALDHRAWHHVVGTYDASSGEARMYFDGTEVNNLPNSGASPVAVTPFTNTRPLRLGRAWGGGSATRHFRGGVDELAIYDRPLTETEIGAIYRDGLAGTGKCPRPSPCPSATPVADYSFEGTANDAVSGHDGTLLNGPSFVSGPTGQALSFDGVDDYVEVLDDPALRITNAVSIEFWARRRVTSVVNVVLEKGGDWNLGEANYGVALHPDPALAFMFYFWFRGGWRGTPAPADTNWHHFAAVARNGDAAPALYVDGELREATLSQGAGHNRPFSVDAPAADRCADRARSDALLEPRHRRAQDLLWRTLSVRSGADRLVRGAYSRRGLDDRELSRSPPGHRWRRPETVVPLGWAHASVRLSTFRWTDSRGPLSTRFSWAPGVCRLSGSH